MALRASIADATRRPAAKPEPEIVQQQPVGPAAAAKRDEREKKERRGLKTIGFWTTKEAHQQMHVAAIRQDRTAESIMNEALNDWFRKNDLPTIAPSSTPT